MWRRASSTIGLILRAGPRLWEVRCKYHQRFPCADKGVCARENLKEEKRASVTPDASAINERLPRRSSARFLSRSAYNDARRAFPTRRAFQAASCGIDLQRVDVNSDCAVQQENLTLSQMRDNKFRLTFQGSERSAQNIKSQPGRGGPGWLLGWRFHCAA